MSAKSTTPPPQPNSESPVGNSWAMLHRHWQQQRHRAPTELFAVPQRFANFSLSLPGLLVDFSKTTLTDETFQLLLDLAEHAQVFAHRDKMFGGDAVNISENRAALHIALRADDDADIRQNGENIMPQVVQSREAMLHFADALRSGDIVAADGKPFTDFLNIGIGGSELGPAMACAALSHYRTDNNCTDNNSNIGLRPHFVSTMDGAHFAEVVGGLLPQRTLVYISSKTLHTAETLANARTACEWLAGGIGAENISAHLAVSTASPSNKPSFLVVPSTRVFCYPQTIGGRYSVWGSVGMPLAAAIGSAQFRELLRGALDMDSHFCNAAPRQNIPLLLALINSWHRNICGFTSRAILPFDYRLNLFPAYLQQLEMESNGKSVQQNGSLAEMKTAPVVWGGNANNAQHAYFQMLHQGADIVPCEFLADGGDGEYAAMDAVISADESARRRRWLLSNCLAQSAALFFGNSSPDLPPHRTFAGARPSVTILYQKLTPYTLGRLLAMYEHRVFVEGVIWNINSFDQWGVELGKALAKTVCQQMDGEKGGQDDSSTRGLIAHCQKWRDSGE